MPAPVCIRNRRLQESAAECQRPRLETHSAASKHKPPQGQPSRGEADVTDSGAAACSAANAPHRFLKHLLAYNGKNEQTHSCHAAIFGNGFFGAPAGEATKAEAEAAAEEGGETAGGESLSVSTLVRFPKRGRCKTNFWHKAGQDFEAAWWTLKSGRCFTF